MLSIYLPLTPNKQDDDNAASTDIDRDEEEAEAAPVVFAFGLDKTRMNHRAGSEQVSVIRC